MRKIRTYVEPFEGDIYYRHYNPEVREAYECGIKEGWRQAMEETYGERSGRHEDYPMRGDGYGERGNYNRMPMREERPQWEEYEERRRRSARTGRYI